MKYFHSKINSRGKGLKGIIVPSTKQDEWEIGETVRVISIEQLKTEVKDR